ncbi:MAG: HAD family hydrolase [Gemmataceae bacterium]|nr:HAD family hydrolase [Gemmataceae bacterium]
MNPSKIRGVALDAVGVLLRPAESIAATYLAIARRFGSKLEPEVVGKRFRQAFGKQEMLDAQAGWRVDEPRERRRWLEIVRETLDDVADPQACFYALFDHFAKPNAWLIDPDIAMLVQRLNERGIPVVVASNFDARLHAVLADHPVRAQLRGVIVSSEIGWRKPAEMFFRKTAEAMNAPIVEVLFVGDDRHNDYDGARAAGMQACLLNPKQAGPEVAASGAEVFDRWFGPM